MAAEFGIAISVELVKVLLPMVAGTLPDKVKGCIASDTEKILKTMKAQSRSRFFEAAVMHKKLELMLRELEALLESTDESDDVTQRTKTKMANVKELASDVYRVAAGSFGDESLKPAMRIQALEIMLSCAAIEHSENPKTLVRAWIDCVHYIFNDAKFFAIIQENVDDVFKCDFRSFSQIISCLVYVQAYALHIALVNPILQDSAEIEELFDSIHKPVSMNDHYWGFVPYLKSHTGDIEEESASVNDKLKRRGSGGPAVAEEIPLQKLKTDNDTSGAAYITVTEAEKVPVRRSTPQKVNDFLKMKKWCLLPIFLAFAASVVIVAVCVGMSWKRKRDPRGFSCYDAAQDRFYSWEPDCTGTDAYIGTKSKTVSGIPCQEWASQAPHRHNASKTGPQNYCRNQVGEPGPWCYTVSPSVRWELCFKECPREKCYDAVEDCFHNGAPGCTRTDAYTGTKNQTVSGITCQYWGSKTPHIPAAGTITGPKNYCRDLVWEQGPWCYTVNPSIKWEFCFKQCRRFNCYDAVQDCFHNGASVCSGPDAYTGTKNQTVSGITCQEWGSKTPHIPAAGTTTGPENYCRNLNWEHGPWCYTVNSTAKWELCFKKCPPLQQ